MNVRDGRFYSVYKNIINRNFGTNKLKRAIYCLIIEPPPPLLGGCEWGVSIDTRERQGGWDRTREGWGGLEKFGEDQGTEVRTREGWRMLG